MLSEFVSKPCVFIYNKYIFNIFEKFVLIPVILIHVYITFFLIKYTTTQYIIVYIVIFTQSLHGLKISLHFKFASINTKIGQFAITIVNKKTLLIFIFNSPSFKFNCKRARNKMRANFYLYTVHDFDITILPKIHLNAFIFKFFRQFFSSSPISSA